MEENDELPSYFRQELDLDNEDFEKNQSIKSDLSKSALFYVIVSRIYFFILFRLMKWHL